jgi:hypothetical protein
MLIISMQKKGMEKKQLILLQLTQGNSMPDKKLLKRMLYHNMLKVTRADFKPNLYKFERRNSGSFVQQMMHHDIQNGTYTTTLSACIYAAR